MNKKEKRLVKQIILKIKNNLKNIQIEETNKNSNNYYVFKLNSLIYNFYIEFDIFDKIRYVDLKIYDKNHIEKYKIYWSKFEHIIPLHFLFCFQYKNLKLLYNILKRKCKNDNSNQKILELENILKDFKK